MKFEVFEINEKGGRTTVWSDNDYHPRVKGGASVLIRDAVDVALKTVIINYFTEGFGISTSNVSASA